MSGHRVLGFSRVFDLSIGHRDIVAVVLMIRIPRGIPCLLTMLLVQCFLSRRHASKTLEQKVGAECKTLSHAGCKVRVLCLRCFIRRKHVPQ